MFGGDGIVGRGCGGWESGLLWVDLADEVGLLWNCWLLFLVPGRVFVSGGHPRSLRRGVHDWWRGAPGEAFRGVGRRGCGRKVRIVRHPRRCGRGCLEGAHKDVDQGFQCSELLQA